MSVEVSTVLLNTGRRTYEYLQRWVSSTHDQVHSLFDIKSLNTGWSEQFWTLTFKAWPHQQKPLLINRI